MLLFLIIVLFFFYFFSFCSMSLDMIPEECFSVPGGNGCISPDYQKCLYTCSMEGKCPCALKPPELSPEVLEENQHNKEIKNISRITQKLIHEIQHAKMKLALLKLNKEIEQLSTAPLNTNIEPITIDETVKVENSC